MSCQSCLERRCWRLSPSIQWHLQQSTPPAAQPQPPIILQSNECVFVHRKRKNGGQKYVLLSQRKQTRQERMRIKLSSRWQLSWQIKPCLADISGLCRMWQFSSLLLHFYYNVCWKLILYSVIFPRMWQKWGKRRERGVRNLNAAYMLTPISMIKSEYNKTTI